MAGRQNRAARRAHLQIATSAPTPPVRDPGKLTEQWSPQPTISRWINTYAGMELDWARVDAIRKNAELGLTEDWADLTRRMYASDDQIFSTMYTYVAAVSGSRREVTARTVAPEYAEVAKAQAEACGRMLDALPNVERSIGELLDGDFVGWAGQEIMWEPRGDWLWPYALEWLHPDRFRFSQTFTPFLWDRGLAASRAQELGIDTSNYIDGYGLPLPANKYLFHTPRILPNYTMVSGILMAVVRDWWFKNWCLKFWLSGAEFAGNPRLLGILGEQGASDAARQELYDALQRMSADSIGVVSGKTTIQILDPKMQGTGGVWESLIKFANAGITKAILGSTLNVEVGDTGGNRSLGESQADMTIAPRWSRSALLVANTIESGLFRPFLELNRHHWGGHVFVPQLTMHIVEDEPEIDQLAIDAGVVKVDQLLRSRKLPPWGPEKGGDAIVKIDKAPFAFAAPIAAEVAPPPPFAATRSARLLGLSRRLSASRSR
jgi:phage gp29-like protein